MRRVLYWLIYKLLFLDFKNKDSNCVGRRYQWKNKLSFDVVINDGTGEEEHERASNRFIHEHVKANEHPFSGLLGED